MIPLGIAGLIVTPVPQGVPADATSEGATEFLRLFERALGAGVAAQVADRPIPCVIASSASIASCATDAKDAMNAMNAMNYPEASRGVSSSVLARHSVLDTESSRALWIPAPAPDPDPGSAGMTNSR